MKKVFKDFFNDENNAYDEEEKKKRRTLIYIIILLIILLLLITSCSCTSNFWGKIGDLFRNEGNYTIDKDGEDGEIIRNQELQFDTDYTEMPLSAGRTRITFSYRNINPNDFTCSTSDASIATCYVASNYVVVLPKTTGEITVYLQTKANGKTYEASTKLVITDAERLIKLDSTEGEINLAVANTKLVSFSLIGITGDITVTSSDEAIATATVKDGLLTITGLKTGTATITLSLTYNNIEYKANYTINVTNTPIKSTGSKRPTKPSDSGNYGQGDGDYNQGETNPSGEQKDSNSTLSRLETNKGTLNFDSNVHEYYIGLSYFNFRISLKAIPTSLKSHVTYIYHDSIVTSLDKLKLNVGDNTLKIIVTSEDGTSTTVYTVVINRAKSSYNYLKRIDTSVGTLEPKFNKNTLFYTIDVDYKVGKIDLDAIPYKRKNVILTYSYNGKTVTSLKELDLNTGENVVKITVTAQNGVSRTYTVVINKGVAPDELDSNSLLGSLTITDGHLDFNPYKNYYYVGVGPNVDYVSLTAKPSSDKYKDISYTFNGKTVSDLNDLELMPGDNEVVITVTAEDGSKSKYTVIINKALPEAKNSLLDLTVSEGALNPSFYPDTLDYKVNVDSKIDKISLYPKYDASASVLYLFDGVEYDNLNDLTLHPGDNVVKIIVANNGDARIYTVTIHRAPNPDLSNVSQFTNLWVKDNVGTLSPEFTSSNGDYYVEVEKDVNKISFGTELATGATITKITYNGEEIKSLDDILVAPGKENTVVITVTAEDGITTKDYMITINRLTDGELSSYNYLDNLIVKDNVGVLDPKFSATTDTYYVEVKASTNEITLEATSSKAKEIIYKYKSANSNDYVSVDSLENLPLEPGMNKVMITVVAQDGTTRDYYVNIYKPVYTVDIEKDSYTFYLEDTTPYNIIYTLYDWEGKSVTDYNLSDIVITGLENFKGEVVLDKGYITLIPDSTTIHEMLNTKLDVTISYNNRSDKTSIDFKTYLEYYLTTYKDTYTFDIQTDADLWNIVFNNNFLVGNVSSTKINNNGNVGIRLSSDKGNGSIEFTTDSNLIDIATTKEGLVDASSIAIHPDLKGVGTAVIHVVGSINGYTIEFDVTVNIIEQHKIVIDANGGFFDAFTSVYSYTFASGKEIDLSAYEAYKVDDTKNCYYYTLESYNTLPDGKGKRYEKNEKITVSAPLTLYAIYEATSVEKTDLKDEGHMYLTDVNLFHNEAYFKEHNEDKVIYPGSYGSYVMTIENNKSENLIIKGITLEEDTICIPELGCLNMGYIIRYNGKTKADGTLEIRSSDYYGVSGRDGIDARYTILNKDANRINDKDNYRSMGVNGDDHKGISIRTIDFSASPNGTISLGMGEKIEISLLWEWPYSTGDKADDTLDTEIGNYAASLGRDVNALYGLTVRIDYETNNKYCPLADTN